MSKMIEEFDGTQIQIHVVGENPVITTKDIAYALGVTSNSIANIYRRYQDEFDEEDSFLSQIVTGKKSRKQRVFTKSGIVQLCFFVKSPKAAAFRRWAKNTLARIMDGTYTVTDSTGAKVDVLAELLHEIASENRKQISTQYDEEERSSLPPVPETGKFRQVLEKEGYQFGKTWLLTLKEEDL